VEGYRRKGGGSEGGRLGRGGGKEAQWACNKRLTR
jgi:hypothetical protein